MSRMSLTLLLPSEQHVDNRGHSHLPPNDDDARFAALSEGAFQWFIGLANLPDAAVVRSSDDGNTAYPSGGYVTSVIPEYNEDHTLSLEQLLEATVSG